MDDYTIYCMVQAKNILETQIKENVNKEFIIIYENIKKYIEENCDHVLVHDLIDIDPDRSKSICYCEKCMTTFPLTN